MTIDFVSARSRVRRRVPLDRVQVESIEHLAQDPQRFSEQREALRRYCFALLRNEADAEDAVQTTLERALRYPPPSLDGGRWLTAIARNVCRDMLTGAAHSEVELPGDLVSDERAPIDPAQQVANRHALAGALHSLSPTERRAVGASWMLDQTSYDAARSVGLAHQTLRVHLSRARKKMALYLDDLERATAGFLPWFFDLPQRSAKRISAALSRDATWADRLTVLTAPAVALAVTIASMAVAVNSTRAHTVTSRPAASAPFGAAVMPVAGRERVASGMSLPAPAAAPAGLVGTVHSILSPGRQQDAYVNDVEPSPNYAQDHTLYATATDSGCQVDAACGELFISHDAGHTWANRGSIGLQPYAQLLLPASAPAGVFYAFGASGLQITHNGGGQFLTLVSDLPGYAGVMPPGSTSFVSVGNTDLWNFTTAPVPGLEGAYLPGMTAAGPAVPIHLASGWALLQPVQQASGGDQVLICGGGQACQQGGTLPWAGVGVKLVTGTDGSTVLAMGPSGLALSRDGGASFQRLAVPGFGRVIDLAIASMNAGERLVVLGSGPDGSRSVMLSDTFGSGWSARQLPAGSTPNLLRGTTGSGLVIELVQGNLGRLAGYACSSDAGATWDGC